MNIGKFVKRMRFQPNDILLIKKGSSLANEDALAKLIAVFEENYKFKMMFIVVDDLDDICKIDQETMQAYGWVPGPLGKDQDDD